MIASNPNHDSNIEKTLEIPCPPFNLTLSHWDQRFAPLYSKRVLCFALPNNSIEHKEDITQMLFAALKSTVEDFPFLAGSIDRYSKERPWVHELRPRGAAYLEVKDYSNELKYSNLCKARFPSALLDSQKLCPFPRPVYNQDGDYPADVCRFRANFVDDGLLLVISIAHTICDGRGISDVLELFAEKFREAQAGDLACRSTHGGDQPPVYTFDRLSVLHGNGLPGALENHSWITLSPKPPRYLNAKTVCTNFHISKESLIALKQAASPMTTTSSPSLAPNGQYPQPSDQTPFISTHDAIIALIWRSIMVARHRLGTISIDTITNCYCPVDCRKLLDLPLPYHGNAVYGAQSTLPLSTLAPTSDDPTAPKIPGLQTTALLIRKSIQKVTADKFRDLLDFVQRTYMDQHAQLANLHDLTVGSILLTSYFGFRMHELEFGEALGGRMEAFRLPSQGLMPGMPVILPKLPDGGCEFVVNEQEGVMAFLAEDEVFQRFVSKQFDGGMKVEQDIVNPIMSVSSHDRLLHFDQFQG